MPYTIHALLGTGATVGLLLLLFMAVTSTVSSSMIAVSSIISFDVYRTYLNPKATDKQVVTVSHLGVVFHGVFITGFALMLNYGGANMSWISWVSPILTCPGIFPLIFTLTWSRQSKLAAVVSPPLGLVTGISIWLGTTHSIYGEISIDTTMQLAPALYGATASLFSPVLYSIILSYIKPEVFDWREFLRIDLVEDKTPASTGSTSPPNVCVTVFATGQEGKTPEKGVLDSTVTIGPSTVLDDPVRSEGQEKTTSATIIETTDALRSSTALDDLVHPFDEETLCQLRRWYKFSLIFLFAIILITFVVWPLPLYRNYIFTKEFFSGWATVAIFWQFFALFAVVIYPIYDGRHEIAKVIRGIYATLRRRGDSSTETN